MQDSRPSQSRKATALRKKAESPERFGGVKKGKLFERRRSRSEFLPFSRKNRFRQPFLRGVKFSFGYFSFSKEKYHLILDPCFLQYNINSNPKIIPPR